MNQFKTMEQWVHCTTTEHYYWAQREIHMYHDVNVKGAGFEEKFIQAVHILNTQNLSISPCLFLSLSLSLSVCVCVQTRTINSWMDLG